jgi:hypothetical protein
LLLLCLIFTANCSGTKFYFFGIDAERLKDINKWEALAGAIVSVGTHVGGHFLAGEITGNHVEMSGLLHEHYQNDSWFVDNGGFMLQHSLGLVLTSFDRSRNWDFTRGYVATAALETWTYPIREDKDASDFRAQHGDFRWPEFAAYSTVALHNVLRVNWGKDENGNNN